MFKELRNSILSATAALLLLGSASSFSQQNQSNYSLPTDSIDIPEQHSSVVCRREAIAGLDAVHERGTSYVGSTTTDDPSEAKVYVSVEGARLYLQSNYLTKGFDFPTKLATDKNDVDLRTLAFNLVGSPEESGVPESVFLAAFPKMQFFVEDKLFSDATFKDLNFNNASLIQVIGSDGQARDSRILLAEDGRKRRIVNFGANLFAFAGSADAPEVFRRLAAETFHPNDVKFLSAVLNSDTQSAVSSLIPAQNRVGLSSFESSDLVKAIKQQYGKLVFIMGHIEGASLVVLDSAGAEVSRTAINDLREIGKTNKVSVFVLGCNSAKVGAAGAATEFNTVDAVKRFSSALHSTLWSEFYRNLATPNLQLVLDKSSLTERGEGNVELTVYQEGPARISRRVGSINHAFALQLPPTTPAAGSGGEDSDYTLVFLFGAALVGLVLFIRGAIKRRT